MNTFSNNLQRRNSLCCRTDCTHRTPRILCVLTKIPLRTKYILFLWRHCLLFFNNVDFEVTSCYACKHKWCIADVKSVISDFHLPLTTANSKQTYFPQPWLQLSPPSLHKNCSCVVFFFTPNSQSCDHNFKLHPWVFIFVLQRMWGLVRDQLMSSLHHHLLNTFNTGGFPLLTIVQCSLCFQ